MLRNRFDEAREAAGATFQFRGTRAKATTDTDDLGHAQKLLGNKTLEITEPYTRSRRGERLHTGRNHPMQFANRIAAQQYKPARLV